jgi:putative DNA primase/helicase
VSDCLQQRAATEDPTSTVFGQQAQQAAAAPGAVPPNSTPGANGTPPPNGEPDYMPDGYPRLFPNHRREMAASGLTVETIRLACIRSLDRKFHAEKITQALRWQHAYAGNYGDCWVVQYPTLEGAASGHFRMKFDQPRSKDGKPIKYEAPVGVPNRAYVPPRTLAVLNDPAVPLVVTEGEKKTLKADQEGFPTIGLAGVYAWHRKRAKDAKGQATGPRDVIDDLAAIPWESRDEPRVGRRVYIVFDSDAVTNRQVRQAECHLAQALKERGAVVKVVRLPPGPPGEDGKPGKVGIDDYFVAGHTADDFRHLLEAATEPEPPEPTRAERMASGSVLEDAADPHRQGRLFLFLPEQVGAYMPAPDINPEALRLRYWNEEFYEHDGAAYRKMPPKEIKSRVVESVKDDFNQLNICDQLEFADEKKRAQEEGGGDGDGEGNGKKKKKDAKPPEARQVTTGLVNNVMQALGSLALLPASVTPPAWLLADAPFPADEALATRNAIVHLPSLVGGKSDFACAPTPTFFTTCALDYDFNPNAPRPGRWLEFLGQLWPDDPESIVLLQDWFGYTLTPDVTQHKMLLLVGPPRGGKGTIARVLKRLVGEVNVAAPTLSSLATNFGLWPLIGKQLAIIGDARFTGSQDQRQVVIERLLTISGGDDITIDRKNLTPVTLTLPTRFVILSNELPELKETSGALANRFLYLKSTRSWLGCEDTKLTDKLLTELPGILLWAIAGWQRLRERGKFMQPESGLEMKEAVADMASTTGAFVNDCCELGPACEAEKAYLYACFINWCFSKGIKTAPKDFVFARDLYAACPGVRSKRPEAKGVRCNVYVGIKVVNPPPGTPPPP